MAFQTIKQKAKPALAQLLLASGAFSLTVWLMIDARGAAGQSGALSEYSQKATVLANLPKFVDWPAVSFPSPDAPFQVCVYGSFRFGTTLAEAVRGQTAHRRRMEVRWVRQDRDLTSCHLLFLSGLDPARITRALEIVHGGATLTVGESDDFLKLGGVVNLVSADGRTYFDVSLESAGQGPLRISSKLLVLARHVVRPPGPAKPDPVA